MGYQRTKNPREPLPAIHTAEQLLRLPKFPFYELHAGVLKVCEPAAFQSSNAAAELLTILNVYVRAHKLGRVCGADGGYVLHRNPDTVLSPDVSFIKQECFTYGFRPNKFFEGPPNLAVEVMSPSDRLIKVQRKASMYLSAGTELVWIIDLHTREAIVCRHDGTTEILKPDGILDGAPVIPGFRCALREIFD